MFLPILLSAFTGARDVLSILAAYGSIYGKPGNPRILPISRGGKIVGLHSRVHTSLLGKEGRSVPVKSSLLDGIRRDYEPTFTLLAQG